MWKNCCNILQSVVEKKHLVSSTITQQIRTTFILKRRYAPQLHKKHGPPRYLKSKNYIYDLVQDTDILKQPDLNVVLTEYVDGIGVKGDVVSLRPNFAYNELLLPGLAVYATPDNLEKHKKTEITEDVEYSSPTAQRMVNILSKKVLSVTMNKEMPWTLKPWHIKVSFRKCGYYIPEETITLPLAPIQGPNIDLENKEFFVTVTINKTEKVQVTCRLHHWATVVTDRLPYDFEFWKKPTHKIVEENQINEVTK